MLEGGRRLTSRYTCMVAPRRLPWAAEGGLIKDGVMHLLRQKGVLPCLRTSPPIGATLGVHRTCCCIPFPRHASGVFVVLGFRGA